MNSEWIIFWGAGGRGERPILAVEFVFDELKRKTKRKIRASQVKSGKGVFNPEE